MKSLFTLLSLVMMWSTVQAKDYEIFDGRVYNNKYYPRIDVVTWNEKKGDPYTQQYHVYWKGHPVEMSFKLDETGTEKIMLVRYNLKERNEIICRRVPAPGNFGQGFKIYKDTSDKDMDNTILSMNELPKKEGLTLITPPAYEPCPEEKEEPTDALGKDPNDPNSYKATPAPKEEPKKPQTEQEKLNSQYQLFN